MNNTLKTGCKAYLDTFSGLIPCIVLSVTGPKEKPLFDLGHGHATSSVKTKVRLTADRRAYKRGEVIESNALHTVPRGAIISRKNSMPKIGFYQVFTDNN